MERAEHGALGTEREEQGGRVTWDRDLGWEWLWEGTGGAKFPSWQGRDAGDQHIVDVVLKMLQGEG